MLRRILTVATKHKTQKWFLCFDDISTSLSCQKITKHKNAFCVLISFSKKELCFEFQKKSQNREQLMTKQGFTTGDIVFVFEESMVP